MGRVGRMAVWTVTGVAGLVLAGWGTLTLIRNASCQSETKAELRDVAGADFQIVYTDCDTLAKDEAISVYVSDPAARHRLFLNRRTLLFKYDPGSPDTPLASIREVAPNHVVIAVPSVSSVFLKNQRWKNLSVEYEIGHVDYP